MQGKVVVITGASRGIGAAAAQIFAAAGAHVALLARDGAAVQALAAGLPGDALGLGCDVADWAAVQAAFAAVQARWGRLDVLVNNAGVIDPIARLAEADPAAWRRAIDINLTGVFHGMRAAVPLMRAQGAGTILTVSSGAAHRPLEGWSAYCAGKAGAAMLTRALHEEEGHWLHAIGLSPGTVATEMQVKIKASGLNAVSQLDPAAHIPADWPARALLWLAGPAGAKWAGQEVSLRDEGIRKEVGLIA
ncbi:NADP-dependent 3-hydroxy acid dehydrogenase YdfG [Gemmobacter aquatilis]|uniref:NADP-dependent 3-hydroxy acid dehydrogenase YdfG n=1 Tax=Gemmobacter aquatilis TaxID=933059 RepID=A0A1H8JMI0_9RHOB|nr:SDR family NAD(P)-dependent oxidoreductase [Gemmobacter aquatilis]SEN81751.1 NADP-dependent 3-hydroxy acid dehydrogenase YdfG [Gemmobacter aquatilis]